MLKAIRFTLCAILFSASAHAHADGTALRLSCDGDSTGASVTINGQFKGECPLDVQVAAGTFQIRAVLPVNKYKERVFEQVIRLGDGVVKRVDIVLGSPQWTEEGQALENIRLAKQKQAEQEVLKQKEKIKLDDALKFQAILDNANQQGAEPDNGKSFKECEGCPEIVLVRDDANNRIVGIGKYDVTRAEYSKFVTETNHQNGGCVIFEDPGLFGKRNKVWQLNATKNWRNPGFQQTDDHPVVCVDINEASEYAAWLSVKMRRHYFVVTEYWFEKLNHVRLWPLNDETICQFGNFRDKASDVPYWRVWGDKYRCNDGYTYTSPVGKFPPNIFGIYDLFGNVDQIVLSQKPYSLLFGGSWATSITDFHSDSREMNDSYAGKLPEGADIRYFVGSTMPRSDVGFRIMTDFSLKID